MTETLASRPAADEAPAREDHRVRVARERRERMRAHLLAAVLHVCSNETARSPAYIDDVVRHAGVSRGTFYKYFESLDQAVDEIANTLGNEMTMSTLPVYDRIIEPTHRVATGFQLFLIRAMLDPHWGAFILRMNLLKDGDLLPTKIQEDIALGVESGDFAVPSPAIACDALMGMKYEAIRRIISTPTGIAYVHSVASMVLRSFGVPGPKADKVVRTQVAMLKAEAPGQVFWWQDFPGEDEHREG